MKKVSLVLVIAVLALSSVFAVDYSKNHVSFVVDPYECDWVVPVDPSRQTTKSNYGAGVEIAFHYSESAQYGLEVLAKFKGFSITMYGEEEPISKYVLALMAKAVVTLPLSEKIGFMTKAGIGLDYAKCYSDPTWQFVFGVDADITYAFDTDLAWMFGVGFDMDFSKSTSVTGMATSRYLSVKTGIVSYL